MVASVVFFDAARLLTALTDGVADAAPKKTADLASELETNAAVVLAVWCC